MERIIRQKIREIERQEKVEILLAVESGSRAWGFASPDSDYDVRFIYARRTEDYLALQPQRDVIEWQLDDVLDISGWDIKKALQLLHKSNPSVFEWCNSPIVYRYSEKFKQVERLLPDYFSVKKSAYHYWNMAESNRKDELSSDRVKLKKYFYIIRPLLAAQWVLDQRCAPPMQFSELAAVKLPAKLRSVVDHLLEQKMIVSELGIAPRIPLLDAYIESGLAEIKSRADRLEAENQHGWDELNACFYRLLR